MDQASSDKEHTEPNAERATRNPPPATFNTALFVVLCLLILAGWAALYRWYSLPAHWSTPKFALDKIPGHFHSPQIRATLALFVGLGLLYALGYWLLRRAAHISRTLRWAILGLAVGSAAVNVLLYPISAIDVFSYVFEMKLPLVYHLNPYLAPLDVVTATDPLTGFSSFFHAPLGYGPAWVVLSALPSWLTGFDNLLRALLGVKLFSLLFVALIGGVIYAYHDEQRGRWLGLYLFLCNPWLLFEAVANAHNDVLMAAFLMAAALALKKRPWAALPLLTLACLIKPFAAALVPVYLWALLRQRWTRRQVVATLTLSALLVLAVTLPFWADGGMLSGMRTAVEVQQTLRTASLYSVLDEQLVLHHAPHSAQVALRLGGVALFALLAAWIMWKCRDVERALAYVLLLFFLLVSSLYSWYLIPIVGLLALRRERLDTAYAVLAPTLALALYPLDVWAWFNSGFNGPKVHLFEAVFLAAPALALLLAQGVRGWNGTGGGRVSGDGQRVVG